MNKQPPKGKEVYTTGEAAWVLQVSPSKMIQLLDGGHLPSYRVPGSSHRRVTRAALEAYVRECGLPTERLARVL